MKIGHGIIGAKRLSGGRGLSGIGAADILGWSPRTLRRWRERYEAHGYGGLFDRRRLRPSARRLPEAVLQLYRDRYQGFNVRHFHEIACREHRVTLSYSTAKTALQRAGLVKKQRTRGRRWADASAATEVWISKSVWTPPRRLFVRGIHNP